MKVSMLQILNAVGALNTLVSLAVPFSVAVQIQKLTKQINEYAEVFNQERGKVNERYDEQIKELTVEGVEDTKEISQQKALLEKQRVDEVTKLVEEEVEDNFPVIDFVKVMSSDTKVSAIAIMGIEPFAKFE